MNTQDFENFSHSIIGKSLTIDTFSIFMVTRRMLIECKDLQNKELKNTIYEIIKLNIFK
jgi:hypothetical protein